MTICTTVSGRAVDLVAPDWRDIDLGDIARALSLLNRFAGQTRRPISVAEHSLVVAKLAPPALALAALLHDAHEAYFGDWPTPAVEAMASMLKYPPAARSAVDQIKHKLDVAVARRVLEDVGAHADVSLEVEAIHLAFEMDAGAVRAADAEALRLEDGMRRVGALQQPSPAARRALALYGVDASEPNVTMGEWHVAVHRAARARYGLP